jgi:predicted phosphoribosyltransferase
MDWMARRFRDRVDAGDRLADELVARGEAAPDAVVLGLPRGGVVVAARVADRLGAELDVVVSRKVGAPGHVEFGIGAVAEGGGLVLDRQSVSFVGVSDEELDELVAAERRQVDERVRRFRGDRPPVPLAGRAVVVVDDGFATGVTARAALATVAAQHPRRLVLAVPVAPDDAAGIVADVVDAFVAVLVPHGFRAVGEFYDDFRQTTDDEVLELLHR